MTLLSEATVSDWNRALTLIERAPLVNGSFSDQGKNRLRRWQNETIFQSDSALFQERLALDHLTEERLLAVLSAPAETLNNEAAWWTELQDAFADEGERLSFSVRSGSDD